MHLQRFPAGCNDAPASCPLASCRSNTCLVPVLMAGFELRARASFPSRPDVCGAVYGLSCLLVLLSSAYVQALSPQVCLKAFRPDSFLLWNSVHAVFRELP